MIALAKVKDGFLEHIGTALAAAMIALFGWLFYQLAPAFLPAIEAIPFRVIVAILLVSVLLNVVLAYGVWNFSRPQTLKLKFGILWDKDQNPHCSVCKNAGIKYGVYMYQAGYYCNPCKEVFTLADASGKDILPADAIKSLQA